MMDFTIINVTHHVMITKNNHGTLLLILILITIPNHVIDIMGILLHPIRSNINHTMDIRRQPLLVSPMGTLLDTIWIDTIGMTAEVVITMRIIRCELNHSMISRHRIRLLVQDDNTIIVLPMTIGVMHTTTFLLTTTDTLKGLIHQCSHEIMHMGTFATDITVIVQINTQMKQQITIIHTIMTDTADSNDDEIMNTGSK